MIDFILAGKIVFLYLAFTYGIALLVKWSRGQPIAAMQNALASTGIIGFITLQWLL